MLSFPYEYRKLGDFTYHVLTDPGEIKSYLMKWIMREWEFDHHEAPDEHWTVFWMEARRCVPWLGARAGRYACSSPLKRAR